MTSKLKFAIADTIAKLLLYMLPRPWATRIRSNTKEVTFLEYNTQEYKTKPAMTLFEGVFATMLFDLALFGTDNMFINWIIKTFTQIQNSWDKPFGGGGGDDNDYNQYNNDHDKKKMAIIASQEVSTFCAHIGIQSDPWIWNKPAQDYTCLNDFFSRTYHPDHAPPIGDMDVVSPACCKLSLYRDDTALQQLLIKGCEYSMDNIGLWPPQDLVRYQQNRIWIGYLSPSDYHRVHAPISGRVVHLQMEDQDTYSASVKFWGSKFNLLNANKRLVVVIECSSSSSSSSTSSSGSNNDNSNTAAAGVLRVALVIVGGVGVNTIVYNPNLLGRDISKGDELSTFRAGGSAIAMFSNRPFQFQQEFLDVMEENQQQNMPVAFMMGESMANIS
jgi:phosphatidylserine decarboxylase